MIDSSIPRALVEQLQAGRCIPWCGAGVSAGSGMPTWQELVSRILDITRQEGLDPADAAEVEFLFDRGAYDDVLDFCRDTIGQGEYQRFLKVVFGGKHTPTPLHVAIAQLGTAAIFTTNYDRMIEAAQASHTGIPSTVLTGGEIGEVWRSFALGEPFTLKVHGDINRAETIVLSRRDYTRHIFGNHAFMQFLQTAFMTRTILFIGTSLGDLYLRRHLEESAYITGGIAMPHFAFMARPGRIFTRLMRDRFNITIIGYGTRTELLSMLQQLGSTPVRPEAMHSAPPPSPAVETDPEIDAIPAS